MTAPSLVADLQQRGLSLALAGNGLRLVGPKGLLTDDLLGQVTAQKPALLEYLTRAAVLDLARSKGFPGLYRYGRYVGAGEKLWEKFCRVAVPYWLELAEQALRDYQPLA